jgi:hypothetical protein
MSSLLPIRELIYHKSNSQGLRTTGGDEEDFT